jgi:hypothetical protein
VTLADRGRGRPPIVAEADEDIVAGAAVPLPPLTPIERHVFDYSDLQLGMAHLDRVIRRTRRSLDALGRGAPATPGDEPVPATAARAATTDPPEETSRQRQQRRCKDRYDT